MPRSDGPEEFNRQLVRSRDHAERPIAEWFKRHGHVILPTYAFSAAGAPKLEAFCAEDSIVNPDLLVARRGLMFWVEVKLKTSVTRYRIGGTDDTGIDRRLWLHYRACAEATGAKVFLAFAHEDLDAVYLDDTDRLDLIKRVDPTDAMAKGGMVFWRVDMLTWLSTLHNVRGDRAPVRASVPARIEKPYTHNDFQRFLGRAARCAEAPFCRDSEGFRPCEACRSTATRSHHEP